MVYGNKELKVIPNREVVKYMELLTRKEVAEYLKVGLTTADKLINDRHFDGKIKIGRRVLISKEKLEEYLEDNMG